MAKVYQSMEELIGNTPLLELVATEREEGLAARLFAKLEGMNPAGSAKDRVARQMLDDAEAAGILKPGGVIIEPTSGNTGVGLAAIGAARGYRVIIVLPDSMSVERRRLIQAYGAELVLTDGKKGMAGAIAKAEELAGEMPGSFIPGQFTNPSNPKAHLTGTGPEIWEALEGKVDVLVAGVGTGGTLTGAGAYLKEKNPRVRLVAVEPASSAVLSGRSAGAHGLQGIGAGFVPEVLDTGIYDSVVAVTEEEAYAQGRSFAVREGILVGISSGAALQAAILLAKQEENQGKNIVVVLPDTGERYLSTPLFAKE